MTELNMTELQLFELFSAQQNWQERYRQLINLAKCLPAFPQEDKIPQYHIDGCENSVWLKTEKLADQTFRFSGDSDGRIVKGLLTILIILAQQKTAAEILQLPFQSYVEKLKVSEGLSESRRLGLDKLISHLKERVKQAI